LHTDNPKPKASTPLRKSAAASLPLREKPNASQGNIQSIFTLTTAERYNIQKLKKSLPKGAQLFQDAFWLPRWTAKSSEGEVFVFYSNGSIVCWGLSEEDAIQFAQMHITQPKAEIGPLKEPETEDLDFIKDPAECVRLRKLYDL
jgi:required for meiotic nuclear division protein 1